MDNPRAVMASRAATPMTGMAIFLGIPIKEAAFGDFSKAVKRRN
jgi:hypothetical protein